MISGQTNNKILNDFEYSSQQVKLQSTPPNIILCTSYKCNMRCIFCLPRTNDPDFNMDMYQNLFVKRLGGPIKNATQVQFTGWGEIFLLPGIEEFLDNLNNNMPEVTKGFTTNGMPLNRSLALKLTEGKYAIQISLHSSNALLHRLLTQTDYFEQIKTQIEYLVRLKKERRLADPQISIDLVFLATTLNIENLPDFVDFAAQIGANAVICNYFTIFTPEQVKLSCFFLKETTNRMFDEAGKRAKRWNIKLVLPPRFSVGESLKETNLCRDPWDHIYVDTLGNLLTCCYAGESMGNLNNNDFLSIWNGEEYADLRSSLIEGRPHKRCRNCFKFFPLNVDDIRAHITFRSYEQENILKNLGLEK